MNAISFKLFTEDSSHYRRTVQSIVSKEFDGLTVYTTTGLWKGAIEATQVIEIVVFVKDAHEAAFVRGQILKVVSAIKLTNSQSAVLVTETQCEMEML